MSDALKAILQHPEFPRGKCWEEEEFPASPLPQLADALQLFGKRFAFARPGSVVSIEYDGGGDTVYTKTARVVGQIAEEIAAAWRATSDAVKTAHDLVRKAKKDGARDLALEALEPLRAAYRGLRDKNQRTAFLARVIDHVTG